MKANRIWGALLLVMVAGGAYLYADGTQEIKDPVPDILGDWTGEWGHYNPAKSLELKKESCLAIDCKLFREGEVWKATFKGICGRPYEYTVTMEARQNGETMLFKSTASIDGDLHDWIGRVTGDEFIGFFTGASNAGVFHMKRKK